MSKLLSIFMIFIMFSSLNFEISNDDYSTLEFNGIVSEMAKQVNEQKNFQMVYEVEGLDAHTVTFDAEGKYTDEYYSVGTKVIFRVEGETGTITYGDRLMDAGDSDIEKEMVYKDQMYEAMYLTINTIAEPSYTEVQTSLDGYKFVTSYEKMKMEGTYNRESKTVSYVYTNGDMQPINMQIKLL